MNFRTPPRRSFAVIVGVLAVAWVQATASAQTLPSTQPAGNTTAQAEDSFRQQLRDGFAALDLTPDQKGQLAGIFATARDDAQRLREQNAGDSPVAGAMRRRHFLEDLKNKTDAVLTPDQRAQIAPAWAAATHGLIPATGPAAVTSSAPPAQAPTTAPAIAANRPGPATAPVAAAIPRPPAPRPAARALPRLQNALAHLDLNDIQHQQIAALIGDAQTQLNALGPDTPPDQRAAKTRQLLTNIRTQLRDILTPQQLVELRDAVQNNAPAKGGAAGAEPVHAPKSEPTARPTAGSAGNSTAAADTVSQQADPQLLPRGTPAPPFTLQNLNEEPVSLAQFRHRVLVLVFGSYSSPIFRDRAAALQTLWRTNDSDGRASLFIVYTREAHPSNGWQVDRNHTDHIAVTQTDTIESRRQAALECRSELHLSIPMLLDSTDDATATAYGTFPDGAVVIDGNGTIVASEHWAEPASLQRAIDEANRLAINEHASATTRP